ncbi:hypothetical protein NPIL_354431, partial [Nephila pilipes]
MFQYKATLLMKLKPVISILSEEEGQDLDAEERNDLTIMLNENKDVFRLVGEQTLNSWITPKGIE